MPSGAGAQEVRRTFFWFHSFIHRYIRLLHRFPPSVHSFRAALCGTPPGPGHIPPFGPGTTPARRRLAPLPDRAVANPPGRGPVGSSPSGPGSVVERRPVRGRQRLPERRGHVDGTRGTQRGALVEVVRSGVVLVARRQRPVGAHHPPPGHRAAVPRHHRADLARPATDDARDRAVRRDPAPRDLLDDRQHELDVLLGVRGSSRLHPRAS